MQKTIEKRLLTSDFERITEVEENEYIFREDSKIANTIGFFDAIKKDFPSSITSQSNTAWTVSNSASLISKTALYENIRSFYLNDTLSSNPSASILTSDGSSTDFAKFISLPLAGYGDRIKPGTFLMSLSSGNALSFNRFISLSNSKSLNYGYNAACVISPDENFLNNIESQSKNSISFEGAFRFKKDDYSSSVSSVTQFLFFRSKIDDKRTSIVSSSSWTYSASSIPSNVSFDFLKYDRSISADSTSIIDPTDIGHGIALTYYKDNYPDSNLTGRFVFQTFAGGKHLGDFKAITSSLSANSMTSSLTSGLSASFVSDANLYDDKWHHLIWNWNGNAGYEYEYGRVYLDGTRLPVVGVSNSALTSNSVARYTVNDSSINAATPMVFFGKISPIDSQITSNNLRIIRAKDNTNFLADKSIKEIGYENNALNMGLFNDISFQKKNSFDTNLYSYFGSADISKYLSTNFSSVATSDKIPDNYKEITQSDRKKFKTLDSVSESVFYGFSGDVGFVKIWTPSLSDVQIDFISDSFPAEYVNISLNSLWGNTGIYKRFNEGKFSSDYFQSGFTVPGRSDCVLNYAFWKENQKAITVKNSSSLKDYSKNYFAKNLSVNQTSSYSYYGSGILINSKGFKDSNRGASYKFKSLYDFFDIPEKDFLNNPLDCGKILYKDEFSSQKTVGRIFYTLGNAIIDTDIFTAGSLSGYGIISSMTAGKSFSFNSSISSNFIVDSIVYDIQKYNQCNYINVSLDNSEFNSSTNPTRFSDQNIVYPTTIGFYNDKDECIAVSKISLPMKKSEDYAVVYKVKLSF